MPQIVNIAIISTHAPAGGATIIAECEEQGIQTGSPEKTDQYKEAKKP